jgi:hypothetical protein
MALQMSCSKAYAHDLKVDLTELLAAVHGSTVDLAGVNLSYITLTSQV